MQNINEKLNTNLNIYKIGTYLLGKRLGGGIRSQVHLAIDMTTGKRYSIKIINKNQMKTKTIQKMIKREVLLMKTMKHKHIVDFIKVHENSTHLFIVLEYMEGGELFDLINSTKGLDIRTTVMLFTQIVKGLSYLHSKGIAHRDIKPENILLDKSHQQIKLIDFGYSLFSLGERIREFNYTDGYIPPEVAKKVSFNPFASDIYTLGIVLHVMLNAQIPDIINGKPPEFEDNNGAGDLLEKMLRENPEERITLEEIKKHPFLQWAYEENDDLQIELYNGPAISKPDIEIISTLSELFDNLPQSKIISLVKSSQNTMKEMYRMIENNCLLHSPRGKQFAKTTQEQVLNTVPTEESIKGSIVERDMNQMNEISQFTNSIEMKDLKDMKEGIQLNECNEMKEVKPISYLKDGMEVKDKYGKKELKEIYRFETKERKEIEEKINEITEMLSIEENVYSSLNGESKILFYLRIIEEDNGKWNKIVFECDVYGKMVDDLMKTIGLLLKVL